MVHWKAERSILSSDADPAIMDQPVMTDCHESRPDRLPWPAAVLVILGLSLLLWYGVALLI